MTYSLQQTMLYLAFTADAGIFTQDGAKVDEIYIQGLIDTVFLPQLHTDDPSQDWKLIWGPAVFTMGTILGKPTIDNIAVVLRNGTSDDYAIAIAGTDARSVSDWILEDFDVITKVPWQWGNPTGDPKISKAVSFGLSELQKLAPKPGIRGAGQRLIDFLPSVTQDGPIQLYVTGHSLGGALCEVMGLYLRDTQGVAGGWDPQSNAAISVYSYAGPSPGDLAFSNYYGQRLGTSTARLWNFYDIVPRAWDANLLAAVPTLYSSVGLRSEVFDLALDALLPAIRDLGYVHVLPDAPPLPDGAAVPAQSWGAEVLYQHTTAYPVLLGVTMPPKQETSEPVVIPPSPPPPPTATA